jgi:hypothetical protein
MPHGQWVAFEYGQPHKHDEPPQRLQVNSNLRNTGEIQSSYSDLDFEKINVGSYQPKLDRENTSAKETQPAPPIRKTQVVVPQVIKPKAQSKRATAPLGLLLGIGSVLLVYLTFVGLGLVTRSFSSIPTSRPTIAPTATVRAAVAPPKNVSPTPTKPPECILWREAGNHLQGQTTCVFGRVEFRRNFLESGAFSYSLIRFSSNTHDLYITSHNKRIDVLIGECISAKAVVSIDSNGILYMEVPDISEYQCPN